MEIEKVSGISCSEVPNGSHSIRAVSSPDRCSNWQSVAQMRNSGFPQSYSSMISRKHSYQRCIEDDVNHPQTTILTTWIHPCFFIILWGLILEAKKSCSFTSDQTDLCIKTHWKHQVVEVPVQKQVHVPMVETVQKQVEVPQVG